jgi:hypothetical protein
VDIQLKDWVLLLIGAVVGLAISHYYYRRSFIKSLTPYLMFQASPMSGAAQSVKQQLEVKFNGRLVSNLIEAQFLVVNDGVKAIRDLIEPLTLKWDASLTILDAQLMSTRSSASAPPIDFLPQRQSPQSIQLPIALMNAGDWFILKVIADGPANVAADWKWSVAVDELPPQLPLRMLGLEDLGRLPISPRGRIRAALMTAGAAVVTLVGFWLLPLLGEWSKANLADGSVGYWAFGVVQLLLGILVLTAVVVAGAAASKSVQGWHMFRKSLPSLPDDVVSDVWRGHSAQADAAERLRKVTDKA